ncbi:MULTISPECIES: hypothetical protein [Pseudofrankia]|uniref:hypothetical protein n=1 Tax=Pseudofrankia TaxID=2994363 RepID=UPI000234D038|nr:MULTISPECIES: hypothetical protein [Pseudofrankia]OHV39112.1 hypothetical protein BCD49_12500 [Pseudofrankia sp. EUN1h]
MPLDDYFSAPDDATALRVLDQLGGPDPVLFDALDLKNLDPHLAVGSLEAVLTGCTHEEVRHRPRFCQLISSPDDEGQWVVTVTDSLRDALAAVVPEDLPELAFAWSDDYGHPGLTPEGALAVLLQLAALASRAHSAGDHLYCRMAL